MMQRSTFDSLEFAELGAVKSGSTQVRVYEPYDFTSRMADAESVYSVLEKSYRALGGIRKGSGFEDPQDMVYSIPVWRVVSGGGCIASVSMFKRNGPLLKMVAYGTTELATEDIKRDDVACFLNFAHAELSGPVLFKALRQLGERRLGFVLDPKRVMPDRWIMPVDEFGRERLRDEENGNTLLKLERDYPGILPYAYVRQLGGAYKLKVLLGKTVLFGCGYEQLGEQIGEVGCDAAYGLMAFGG